MNNQHACALTLPQTNKCQIVDTRMALAHRICGMVRWRVTFGFLFIIIAVVFRLSFDDQSRFQPTTPPPSFCDGSLRAAEHLRESEPGTDVTSTPAAGLKCIYLTREAFKRLYTCVSSTGLSMTSPTETSTLMYVYVRHMTLALRWACIIGCSRPSTT